MKNPHDPFAEEGIRTNGPRNDPAKCIYHKGANRCICLQPVVTKEKLSERLEKDKRLEKLGIKVER